MDTDELSAINAPALPANGIRHAFFTRQGGVSEGLYGTLNAGRGSNDAPEAVAENRRRIANAMGVDTPALISMNQTHSASVMTVTAEGADRPRVDALVTAERGLALSVLHADCAPVLFADPKNGVIGAAHAGWRGAVGGIIEATLEAMGAIGAVRSSTVAVIGPTIAQRSYEVGPDFPVPIVTALPAAAAFFTPSTRYGHHMFDLPGYILMRLHAAGVGRTENLDIDTYADEERFFSYRRNTHRGETDYGRLLSAIVLEG